MVKQGLCKKRKRAYAINNPASRRGRDFLLYMCLLFLPQKIKCFKFNNALTTIVIFTNVVYNINIKHKIKSKDNTNYKYIFIY